MINLIYLASEEIITPTVENFSELDLKGNITEFQKLETIQDPIFWLSIGIFICLLSGIIFADIIRTKIRRWTTEKLSPIPLANPQSISSWVSFYLGLTIIFTSTLDIFNFPISKPLIFSVVISILFGTSMWNAIKDLMVQIKSGTVKEIDEFF